MSKRTVFSYATLSVLLFFSLLLLTNTLLPISRAQDISSMIAFAQQPPGSIPETTEAATVTPASEIGTTIRPELNSSNEYRRSESHRQDRRR